MELQLLQRLRTYLLKNQSDPRYSNTAPSPQDTVDLFKGEWSSALPLSQVHSGQAKLFQDPRILWAIEQLGGVKDKTILELGPLEGAHSALLEWQGAKSILAIEAHSQAYLRCLTVKELLELTRVKFLYGDFQKFLESTKSRFDICLASGVLYHMTSPIALLSKIALAADSLILWTHYYDSSWAETLPRQRQFESRKEVFEDQEFPVFRHYYRQGRFTKSFCGGMQSDSFWLDKSTLLQLVRGFGFKILAQREEPLNSNGPSLTLVASHSRSV